MGMLKTPGEVAELFSTVIDPSALVISAEIFRASDAGSGDGTGPVGVQFVLTQLTVIVPPGVTVQDCEAVPPEELVAVAAKLLGARDCAAVGVQVMVFPLREAPVGELVTANSACRIDGSQLIGIDDVLGRGGHWSTGENRREGLRLRGAARSARGKKSESDKRNRDQGWKEKPASIHGN